MKDRKDFLSQLLPYDTDKKKNACLRTSLKEYQLLLQASLEANLAWQKGELEKFDSLVGESACEIRAIWLALKATKYQKDLDNINNRLRVALDKITALSSPKVLSSLMRSDISLKTILEREGLEIPLTSQEQFRIQSFLLTVMKDVKPTEEQMCSLYRIECAEPKKLVQFGDASTSFARHLLSKLRESLAASSVQFVQEKAFALENINLLKMVFTVLQNALPCVPKYWTCKVVFSVAQKERIPLVIHAKFLNKENDNYKLVDEDKLFFLCDENGDYAAIEPSAIDRNRPACVIQGVVTPNAAGELLTKSEWRAAMKERPITDIILAGAADHRQYPDPTLEHLFEALNDSEYESYTALAKQRGFSAENPTTFFIQHLYAARTNEIMEISAKNGLHALLRVRKRLSMRNHSMSHSCQAATGYSAMVK